MAGIAAGFRTAPEAMLAALQAIKRLWDEHGLGDDPVQSDGVYAQMARAIRAGEAYVHGGVQGYETAYSCGVCRVYQEAKGRPEAGRACAHCGQRRLVIEAVFERLVSGERRELVRRGV